MSQVNKDEADDVIMKDKTDDNENKKNEPKSWMQQLGELATFGWIRNQIEKEYKDLYIPQQLKTFILEFIGMEFIDSKILLTEEQKNILFSILSSQCDVNVNILSGLRLLYRASEHEFAAQSFHALCDNHKNAITIIKVNNHIFGGYLSCGFANNNKFCGIKNDMRA